MQFIENIINFINREYEKNSAHWVGAVTLICWLNHSDPPLRTRRFAMPPVMAALYLEFWNYRLPTDDL